MANAGDKFVIEIDSVFGGKKGEKLYRVKGFNSLVFDDYGLEKLPPYKEPEKEQEREIERGMVYQKKDDPAMRVVVTRFGYGRAVHFVECKTGRARVNALDVFQEQYKNTGESVSSYLEVVLGNLPF